jgi:hypothetical protein
MMLLLRHCRCRSQAGVEGIGLKNKGNCVRVCEHVRVCVRAYVCVRMRVFVRIYMCVACVCV